MLSLLFQQSEKSKHQPKWISIDNSFQETYTVLDQSFSIEIKLDLGQRICYSLTLLKLNNLDVKKKNEILEYHLGQNSSENNILAALIDEETSELKLVYRHYVALSYKDSDLINMYDEFYNQLKVYFEKLIEKYPRMEDFWSNE